MVSQIEQITAEQIRAGQLATQTWESTAFPPLVKAVRINFPLCNKYFFFRWPQGMQSWLNMGVGEGSEAVSFAADVVNLTASEEEEQSSQLYEKSNK